MNKRCGRRGDGSTCCNRTQTTLAPDGLTISQANGSAAGQTVPHYHVHLMPRTAGVKLRSHGSGVADPARLTELAGAIRANMPSA